MTTPEVLRPSFNFNAAFDESSDGEVYGVWVGEHGFLVAVFRDRSDAEAYVKTKSFRDIEIGRINLYEA